MSGKEKTFNDSYLITNIEENLIKKSYRTNLIKTLKDLCAIRADELASLNVNSIGDFRKLVLIAEENGYEIYQLTRL